MFLSIATTLKTKNLSTYIASFNSTTLSFTTSFLLTDVSSLAQMIVKPLSSNSKLY